VPLEGRARWAAFGREAAEAVLSYGKAVSSHRTLWRTGGGWKAQFELESLASAAEAAGSWGVFGGPKGPPFRSRVRRLALPGSRQAAAVRRRLVMA
jgi:hypothetical protein